MDHKTKPPTEKTKENPIAAALVILLCKWGGQSVEVSGDNALILVEQFLEQYPVIGAAIELRAAGLQVLNAAGDIRTETILGPRLLDLLTNALNAAGTWDQPEGDEKEEVNRGK